MNIRNLLFIFLVAELFFACSTGKTAYKRGNYYDATMQAVQRLRTKPDSEDAIQTLRSSYPMALDYYKQKVNELNLTNNPDKYVQMVEIYTRLNMLADEITRCPAALDIVRPVTYFHDQVRTAKDLAAKEQYERAAALLKSGYLEDAQAAFNHLLTVKQFKPDFPDIERMLLESEDKGTMKIVVEQIPVHSNALQVSAKVFYDRMYTYMKRNVERKFLRFYHSKDAEELKIVPHHIVRMNFADFVVGNIHDREIIQEFKSDSVVMGTITDAQGIVQSVKGIVTAKVTTYHREVLSKGFLDVNVISYQTDEVLTTRRFPGEFIWVNEFATFNGDQRAVPADKMKLVNQKQQLPPSPQDLFLLFSDPIFASSSSFLSSYYRRK